MDSEYKILKPGESVNLYQGQFWLVEEGSLDLFAVGNDLSFLGELNRDQLLFALPESKRAVHLEAKAGIETRLRLLSPDQLCGSRWEQWVSDWVRMLSHPVTESLMKERPDLWPDSGIFEGESATNVVLSPSLLQRRASSLAWMRVQNGTALVGARTQHQMTSTTEPFPISERIRITSESNFTVELLTNYIPTHDSKAWVGFYDWVYDEVQCDLKHREQRNHTQVERTNVLDKALMANSSRVLASVLDHNNLARDCVSHNPLVSACDAVAKFMGMSLGQQREDPDASRPYKEQMDALCSKSHIRFRRVHLDVNFWKEDHGPLIGFLSDQNRPVALLPAHGRSHYTMLDPSGMEPAKQVDASIAGNLSSEGFMLYQPFPTKPFGWPLLRFATQGYTRDIGIIAFSAALSSLLLLYVPMAMSWIFDKIVPNHTYALLYQVCAGFVAVAVGHALFMITKFYALLRLEGNVGNRLQSALWDRLLRIRLKFYRNYSTGDLFQRVSAFDQMRQILGGSLVSSLIGGCFSVSYLFVMGYHSPKLTLILLVPVVIAVIIYFIGLMMTVAKEMRVYDLEGRLNGLLVQILNGVAKIRVSGSENRAYSRWADLFSKKKDFELQSARIQVWLESFKQCFPLFSNILLYFLVVYTIQSQLSDGGSGMATGQFLAFSTALGAFSAAILSVADTLSQVAGKVVPLWRRARTILDEEPEIVEGRADVGKLSGHVSFDHLSFRYSKELPFLLDEINLEIQPGQFAAIVGSSGCGKSTLVKLLLGFEVPEIGKVVLDGHDLSSLDPVEVRKQIGVVLQDGAILAGTLRNNVTCGRKYTDDAIKETLKFCGFAQELEGLPMGLDTILPVGGGTLSGGQRQRLMIARAVMAKPSILIFDEATSALDNETQELVSKNIDKLNATRIVIAHRLSTIQNADVIFLLHQGQVVDSGTYNELMQRSEFFQTLVKRQT